VVDVYTLLGVVGEKLPAGHAVVEVIDGDEVISTLRRAA